MKRKITILLAIVVLFILSIASMPVSADLTKDLGNVYYRNGITLNLIYTSSQGTTADYFYFKNHIHETRDFHDQYKVQDRIDRGESPDRFAYWDQTVNTNEIIDPEQCVGLWAWYYLFVGQKTVIVEAWTTWEGRVNGDTSVTTITISKMAENPEWDWIFCTDFNAYPDSTIEVTFSDNDYELVDVPDAGETTWVETEHGHELELTTDEDNEILYIIISEADTATSEITFSVA